nr:hypothetical protein [Micromonospora sp. DSM 115978]
MSILHPTARHPKVVLYDVVYDPLVVAWFTELRESPELARLLREAPTRDVVQNLERLDAIFHHLVDAGSVRRTAAAEHVAATLEEHRDHLIWEGQMPPAPDASRDELMASFRHKLRRNISLAALEALICLESAIRYARDTLGLSGPELTATVRRSTMLAASLAALHDLREKTRMHHLIGSTEEIMYPNVGYADVVGGRYRIDDDKFTVIGPPGGQKLRFRKGPPDATVLDSPTIMCPAQRIDNAHGEPLNNEFWYLLVDVYRASGRLA